MKTNDEGQVVCEDCGRVADVLDRDYEEGYCRYCASLYGPGDWDSPPLELVDGRLP